VVRDRAQNIRDTFESPELGRPVAPLRTVYRQHRVTINLLDLMDNPEPAIRQVCRDISEFLKVGTRAFAP